MGVSSNAPVIIKRKKIIAGGGHHGGAWKVAYADFVTAMMAFFMLMWLLNATTETQRKGLADYFSPSIPVMRISGGGDGSFGGDSVFSDETLAENGTGAPQKSLVQIQSSGFDPTSEEAAEQAAFSDIESALTALAGESMVSTQALRHIVTRVTDEGLIVELFDLPGEELFHKGTDTPTNVLDELTVTVAGVFRLVENQIAISGFTRANPIVLMDNPVWSLSSARADRVRLMMQDGGFPADRVQRITGYADRKPAAGNPMAQRNNRIEIILLRQKL